MEKGEGSKGFGKDYWDHNYSEAENMDAIGNVKEHVAYIKSLFALEMVDISSMIDFGFGYGHLLNELLKAYYPFRAYGIEPSEHAFQYSKGVIKKPVSSMNLTLKKMDLLSWCKENKQDSFVYDLGICTSVFQYLTDRELDRILPVLAKKVKYLYLTAPTDKELNRQIDEIDFHDTYAIRRSKSRYQRLIRPHFTVVSSRMLESKIHFTENDSFFTDLLYRF